MAALLNASERDKVDDVLRLPGLKFPKGKRVIGNKHTDLMMAIGAIDTMRGRTGKQLLVVRRLAFLYQAVLLIQKENPTIDIFSDRFYEVALLSISDKYHDVSKNLTPETFRHVIDLYTKAFARSGWKVIRKPVKSSKQKQMASPVQGDVPHPNGDSGEKDPVEQSTEILQPIEPIGDRVNLEKLVKEWMIVRGIARHNGTAAEKPDTTDTVVPQQKPDEPVSAYMLRIQHEFQSLHMEKQADEAEFTNMAEEFLERVGGQIKDINKRHDGMQHALDTYEHIYDRQNKLIDCQKSMIGRQDNIVGRQDLLNDKLNEAMDRQTEILVMEDDIIDRQTLLNNKVKQTMDGQDFIVDIQVQINEKVDEAMNRQVDIMDRQVDIMDKQDHIMDIQGEVMDEQDLIMGKQDIILETQDGVMKMQNELEEMQFEMTERQHEILNHQAVERHLRLMPGSRFGPEERRERYPGVFEGTDQPDL